MRNPHHRKATLLLALVAAALFTLPAQAVIVRGKVLTPFSLPLGNVRVELVQGHQIVAFAITQMDGSYEIRSSAAGHFLLLTAAAPYTPNIGEDFYGDTTGVVTRNVVMQFSIVNSQLVVTSSGIPTPIQQIPSAVTLTPQVALTTQIGIVNDLRQSLGTFLVQTGQAGGPTALYIRGGSPDANKVLTDGVPSTNIGGYFDLSPVSTIALKGPELYRGANSALQGTGAEAGILNLSTTHGTDPRPVLNYTGDAGNFYTYRNEGIVSGVYGKLDFLAGFSRFNTSNALPRDQYHTINSIANIGYAIFTNTLARFTLRNTTSAVGLPSAHDIYGISSSGKQANQDIYSGLAIENTLAGNWHNLARYGISRQREQVQQFTPTGLPVITIFGGDTQTTYYGDVVTLRGGNGYTATGQAAFILPAYDSVSNRDELYYQSDYRFPLRISALFSFNYEYERGRLLNPATQQNQIIKRTNYLYTLQIQGDIQQRLFYSFGGAIINNQLFGITGTPRIGLTYDAIRPSVKPFNGTVLHANLSTGVQEPSLVAQLTSLYTLLQQTGNATYNVPPITSERNRTYSLGLDQNILNQKLILHANYFHNQFDHQLEFIGARGLEFYFDIPANIADQLPPPRSTHSPTSHAASKPNSTTRPSAISSSAAATPTSTLSSSSPSPTTTSPPPPTPTSPAFPSERSRLSSAAAPSAAHRTQVSSPPSTPSKNSPPPSKVLSAATATTPPFSSTTTATAATPSSYRTATSTSATSSSTSTPPTLPALTSPSSRSSTTSSANST